MVKGRRNAAAARKAMQRPNRIILTFLRPTAILELGNNVSDSNRYSEIHLFLLEFTAILIIRLTNKFVSILFNIYVILSVVTCAFT